MFGLTFSYPLALLLLPPLLGWAAWLWLRDQGNLSRLRHRVALALRLAIIAALVLVLAGATWQQTESRQATVFVADLSASMAGATDREAQFIARALQAHGHDDVSAVVAVGGDALVEQSIAALNGFAGFQSVVERSSTNLETGLNLAGALFPVGYRKRVVLLSDGQQNSGDTLAAARLLRDEGVRLDVYSLAPAQGSEALITGVEAPSSLRRGAALPVTVALRSTVAQPATLDVLVDGVLQSHTLVALTGGDQRVSLSLRALDPGFHRVRAVLHPRDDTVLDNNEGGAVTHVRGAPHVLVAEGQPGEGNIIAASLRAKGMQVEQITADKMEASAAYLSRYDAVVMADVPAIELDPLLVEADRSPLKAYVDGGGGLVVTGGPDSYGVGGYTGTALDDLLPVSMKLPQRKDTPSVAVALIIEDLESQTNVNISKAAGEGVVKLLTPLDRVAVNDANGTDVAGNGWAVPLQYVTNKVAINRAIDAMQPIDPASYIPSLQAAFKTLRNTNARIKHIILLGDGDASDTYYPLVSRIRKAGITISVVATGAGGFGPSDYGVMQNIARWGGGHYYQSDNVNAIPQIFLKETKQIARTGIVEERFNPDIVNDSPIIADIPGVPLDGYVATTPKPLGTQVLMHLTRHGLDPLLAQWQYGLGRVVAWTSDAQGRWSGNLVASGQGNRLWANMVSWVLPPESSPNLAFASSLANGRARLTVTTIGLPLDTRVTARIDGPAHSATVTFEPTGPGTYQADVPATSADAYFVGIRATVNNKVRASLRTGLVVPYAQEYATSGQNRPLLAEAAVAGNGALVHDPAASFADNLAPVYAPQPLTAPLLLLALLLLPVDIAVRRLLIGLAELRAWLAAPSRRRVLQPAVAAGAAGAPLTAVRARRVTRQDRVAARSAPRVAPAPVTQPPASQPPVTQPPASQPPVTQPPASQPPVTQPPASQPPATQPVAASFTAGRPLEPRTARTDASPAHVATPAHRQSIPPTPEQTPTPASAPTASSATAEAESTTSRLLEAKRRRRGG